MARSFAIWLSCALALVLVSSLTSAAIVEHTFTVEEMTVNKVCRNQVITAVNGSLPGPTIHAREGDTLVVHVHNKSPYDMTIHWHGIMQLMSAWADGPAYATQCPIRPGQSFTYRFNITGQEGTLWWHSHVSWIRATVYGALIIQPKSGRSAYPFPKPHQEIPILLGEWWNGNVVEIEEEALALGSGPPPSDAYTINGKTGDVFPNCSQNEEYKVKVKRGRTYMLRMINAALNTQLFFKIANHSLTVVAVDAAYTKPYVTDVVVLAPGQTADVLVKTDQAVGNYYMDARPYVTNPPLQAFNGNTTRGIFAYERADESATPAAPAMPDYFDTPTAHRFYTNLTGLEGGPQWVPVPLEVDERMFVTFGLNFDRCLANSSCAGDTRLSASMNNESFVLPHNASMLEAFYYGNRSGVYTTDFPDNPPVVFDYTNTTFSFDTSLLFAPKSTKVKTLKFNATVEMVLQNTALLSPVNHPMHIHGFNFHVLAQGFGNYDAVNDRQKFNLVDPQIRNTIAVPDGGWAVIRFQANNPGIWLAHCHLDVHLPIGMSMAFEVENGPTAATTLPPPPSDLPKC